MNGLAERPAGLRPRGVRCYCPSAVRDLEPQQKKLLASLYPTAQGADAWQDALDTLLRAELERRGERELRTGALAKAALTQGPLLEKEYDHSLHGHIGWTVGALVVDVQKLIRFNVRYGFNVGDAILREVVATLGRLFPTAKVVRTHTDAFAALFLPFSEQRISEAVRTRAMDLLRASVSLLAEEAERQVTAKGEPPDGPRPEVGFTLALLELEVRSPSHWQVLGPLVWAETERALMVERRGEANGVQRRAVDLAGAV